MRGLVKGTPRSFQSNFSGSITNYAIDSGVKGHLIPLVFSPSGLTDTVQASFHQETIPGASAPQITYTATGARQVSFSLELPLDYLPPNSDYNDFEEYLNAFRALVYPKYSASGGKVESPHCKLVTSNIELDGVCQNCTIEYKVDRYANDGSMAASISLSFLEVLDNVKDVDAKWIANSKVKVLGNTNMSVSSSNQDSSNFNINTTGSNRNDKCYFTLLGNLSNSVSHNNASIKSVINAGKWKDPGYAITNTNKYTIKCFYGSDVADSCSVSDIKIESLSSSTCVCNGKTVTLYSEPTDTTYLIAIGTVVTYFILYVPVYDGNKYEVSSCKIRQVHIKVV